MEHKFNVGDIVQVKVGGPKMWISTFDKVDIAKCRWFNTLHELQYDYFHVMHLKYATP